MMAPAMNTPEGDRLRIADLAKLSVLKRVIPEAALERMQQVVQLLEPVTVQMALERDEQSRHWLRGEASTRVAVDCHRCLEPVEGSVATSFELWLVDEQQLDGLRQADPATLADADVRLIADGMVDVTLLIEDELLLELDMQPCREADCPQMPVMQYGSTDDVDPQRGQSDAASPAQAETQRPFADLKQLLRESQKTGSD